MIETLEAPAQEVAVVEPKTLEEILPVVQQLSAHDKLVLIRILADELAMENKPKPTLPPGTYEIYTPYDIEGIPNDIVERYNKMPPPQIPDDAT